MGGELYLTDAYLLECPSTVVAHTSEGVVLSQTVFYPSGGGQPGDSGVLKAVDGPGWKVASAEKSPQGVNHYIAGGERPALGAAVTAVLDWSRRYAHMRYHTALHILSGVAFRKYGAGITGGQIYDDRARMDFPLADFDRTKAEQILTEMNAVVREDRRVTVRFLSREELTSQPSLVRVASELMPDLETVRLIDIEGFDVQADGGTHVASTREVGPARLEKIENKGSRNKRLYLSLLPSVSGT